MAALFKFFGLTFAASWAFFIAGAAGAGAFGHPLPVLAQLESALFLIGAITPGLVALWLAARAEGSSGAKALLSRAIKWDVEWSYYLLAILYMPLTKLLVALTHRVITGAWPHFGNLPLYLIVPAIVVSTPVQSGEEIGWRGYALPRLDERMGLRRASLLLGAVWALWHLPFFYVPGIDMYRQSFPVFTLSVVAVSIAMAWLYARTNQSLLLTMLMHSTINQTSSIVSDVGKPGNPFSWHAPLSSWLTAGLLWIAAAYFLLRMPKTIGRSEQAVAGTSR